MSTAAGLGSKLDDQQALAGALDRLIAGRPDVFALGEPVHGIEAFPLLRNDILAHLVERGYRSVVLETDSHAASIVDDYVAGGPGDLDDVLATGFSHGFGTVPGNRELVQWLRTHNAARPPAGRVRFHGFDAPTEYAFAPSPRRWLTAVADYLPAALRPASIDNLDALLGDDAEWSNEKAMFDPEASIGDTERARALRLAADDLASSLHRAAPSLAGSPEYQRAVDDLRTAQGLLRYHAGMAGRGDRMAALFSLRSAMMAENLLAIVERERDRGPCLVFAHNLHLRRALADDGPGWGGAGALVAFALGRRYLVVATDGSPHGEPGTLHHALAQATTRRTLFPAKALRAKLSLSIGQGKPMVRGHLPLDVTDLDRVDAVSYVADTDGEQHWNW